MIAGSRSVRSFGRQGGRTSRAPLVRGRRDRAGFIPRLNPPGQRSRKSRLPLQESGQEPQKPGRTLRVIERGRRGGGSGAARKREQPVGNTRRVLGRTPRTREPLDKLGQRFGVGWRLRIKTPEELGCPSRIASGFGDSGHQNLVDASRDFLKGPIV